jgi:transposase
MSHELTVDSERVDDIPLLVAQQARMGLPELLDSHFPTHGNRQGLSVGWLTTLWLSYILSQGDHRLSSVQFWAKQRLATLQQSSGQAVSELDFSDDRLADVLSALSNDRRWQGFEIGVNQRLLRVYDLSGGPVRLDSTTAAGYWTVTDDGLLQFGHSKDHRPDLPQVKIMLSTLDPLGLPLVSQIVAGSRADDGLYVPAVAQVRQAVGRQGLLYIGDSKMGALETRAYIQAGGDYYLCPLGQVQLPPTQLAAYLAAAPPEQVTVTSLAAAGSGEVLASGWELSESLQATVAGQPVQWTERRLVVRSAALADKAIGQLQANLTAAQDALAALTVRKRGKKVLRTRSELQAAAEAILDRYAVGGLLHVSYSEESTTHMVRAYKGRAAGPHTSTVVSLQVTLDRAAVQTREQSLGWRVYATNQPAAHLSLPQAVLAYRSEYLIEHGFARLKGRPLALAPTYLHSDARVKGLVRLLTIGLRILTLLEYTVRHSLAQRQMTLTGLYPENPQRASARPTAERLLVAYRGVTLSVIHLPGQLHRYLTPLSELQQRILTLLELPADTYSRLAMPSQNSP